jgi:hypothetical protein
MQSHISLTLFNLHIETYQDTFQNITLPFCLKRDSSMILSSILNFSMTTNFTIFCGQGRVTWDRFSYAFLLLSWFFYLYNNSLCTTLNITICDRVWDCEQKSFLFIVKRKTKVQNGSARSILIEVMLSLAVFRVLLQNVASCNVNVTDLNCYTNVVAHNVEVTKRKSYKT